MFGVTHADGSGDDNSPLESLSALYDELATATSEHGDVSVINDDTGWCLSAHRDGRVIFGHLRDGHEQHMVNVPKARVLALWKMLIDGEIDRILAEPWRPEYR